MGRADKSALIVAAEGMGKTTLANHAIANKRTTCLGVRVDLHGETTSILAAIQSAIGRKLKVLFEQDADLFAKAAEVPAAAGTAFRLLAGHLTDEQYDVDTWFHLQKGHNGQPQNVEQCRAHMDAAPALKQIQNAEQLIDVFVDCARAVRMNEHTPMLWLDFGPVFDWQKHEPQLRVLLSRARLRDSTKVVFKILVQPSGYSQLAKVISINDCFAGRQHELSWTFESLFQLANRMSGKWLDAFAQRADNLRRLQDLYDDSLKSEMRRLAPSPKCWIRLAQLLKERSLTHIVDESAWHYAVGQCCAATRKLRIDDIGIYIGGDKIDEKGLLTPSEQRILRAIYALQSEDLPAAGEIAAWINARGFRRKGTNANSVQKSIHELRCKVFFEPIFRWHKPQQSIKSGGIDQGYLIYLRNGPTHQRYVLENTE
jgi:hypothetical protein